MQDKYFGSVIVKINEFYKLVEKRIEERINRFIL